MGVVTPLPLADLPRSGWADGTELARTVLAEVAERARTEAQAQGYAIGWARGRRDAAAAAAEQAAADATATAEAEARREAEHRAAVAALASAAEQVRDALAVLQEQVAAEGTDLALALTETLLAREISTLTDADVVRRVLAASPAPAAKVRLHPLVAGSVDAKELADAGLVVVPDPTLDTADAVVEGDGSVTDLRIGAAMERLREALA
ncbi:flagellar assembly protein FliH [Nocardioides terrae]|uniref:Flagellar assembly protein FliH n=1 Tax=Nocardioides terrae TaxID=574651 RepID=A0A1I1I9V4_9ACTN|nr:FliH/SctL family protein [Nocardioides terrae]SFC32815.1 flagellar assembly protein FliH [Nocardioides terrae]